jgi:hypothetical protein
MPLPPLAARERLLARFASLSALGCTVLGLGCALWPRLVFRAFALGGPATSSAGMRLFGALGGAALLGVAVSVRRTALRPREDRGSFFSLLTLLGGGALFAAWSLLRARGPGVPASATQPLEVAALALSLLFILAAVLFVRGAPGVNVGPVAVRSEGPAAKPVALGVRPAAAGAAPVAPAPASADGNAPSAESSPAADGRAAGPAQR